MSIDIFQPRVMRDALEQLKPPRTDLRKLFFSTVETSDTEYVDIDIVTENRRMAPFVNLHGPGKVVERAGFTTSTVSPPMIAPKMPVTIPDIQSRAPGEHIYAARSAEQRLADLVRRDLQTMEDMIARREEWMCAQVLFTSKVRVLGDDVDMTINFDRDASLTKGLLTAGDRWSAATSDIPKMLRTWRRDLIKLNGLTYDVLIASPEALDALLTNELLIGSATKGGQLNTLNLNMGQISPEASDGGLTYFGMFAGTGVKIYSYDEWYVDPQTGVEQPMVPPKTILLGASRARNVMRYGAVGVKASESGIALVSDSRVPESWVEREPAVRWMKVSSRPLPVPVQNSFLTAQVIA